MVTRITGRVPPMLYTYAMKKALLITLAYVIYFLVGDMSDALSYWTGLESDDLFAICGGIIVIIFMYGTYGGNPVKYVPRALLVTFTLIGISYLTRAIILVIANPEHLTLAIEFFGSLTLAGLAAVWIRRRVGVWMGGSYPSDPSIQS